MKPAQATPKAKPSGAAQPPSSSRKEPKPPEARAKASSASDSSFASALARIGSDLSAQHTSALSPNDEELFAGPACESRPIDTPLWTQNFFAEADRHAALHAAGVSTTTNAKAPTETNLGAMFEQFVSGVRVGKVGDLSCVSLTLDLGGGAPVQVIIEETSVGPMIGVQSDNPAQALAFERALNKR